MNQGMTRVDIRLDIIDFAFPNTNKKVRCYAGSRLQFRATLILAPVVEIEHAQKEKLLPRSEMENKNLDKSTISTRQGTQYFTT
jgi:hypothetical protein